MGRTRLPKHYRFKRQLLQLPVEIQLQIYKLVLIEVPRWDKLHEPLCEYKPRYVGPHELPPFAQTQVDVYCQSVDDETPTYRVTTHVLCKCAKRKGTGLLATCRYIHAVAAPIFWARNTFCMASEWELLAAAGDECQTRPATGMIRQKYIALIRAISIMKVQFPHGLGDRVDVHITDQRRRYYLRELFWGCLPKFPSLHWLDVPAPEIYGAPTVLELEQVLTTLDLPDIHLNHVLRYQEASANSSLELREDQRVTYTRCITALGARTRSWDWDSIKEAFRDVKYNFCVHARTAVDENFITAQEPWRAASLDISIDDRSTTRSVTLPTGKSTTITFYGVPISKKTRQLRAKELMDRDKRQKEENGLIWTQHIAIREKRARRKHCSRTPICRLLPDEERVVKSEPPSRLDNRAERTAVEAAQASREADKARKRARRDRRRAKRKT